MTHADLVERAAHWLRNSMDCGVVLTERQSGSEIPDAIGWGKFTIVVECKVSRSDFRADLKKPHRSYGMGQLRFYMTPPALVSADEVPDGWGLLEAGRAVRRMREAIEHADSRHIAAELRLALGELRRYQIHGIVYPPLPDGSMPGRVPGFGQEFMVSPLTPKETT